MNEQNRLDLLQEQLTAVEASQVALLQEVAALQRDTEEARLGPVEGLPPSAHQQAPMASDAFSPASAAATRDAIDLGLSQIEGRLRQLGKTQAQVQATPLPLLAPLQQGVAHTLQQARLCLAQCPPEQAQVAQAIGWLVGALEMTWLPRSAFESARQSPDPAAQTPPESDQPQSAASARVAG